MRSLAETPWKAIGLAVTLLCIGTLFLTLGVIALQGNLHVEDKGTPRELVRRGIRRSARADAQPPLALRARRSARGGADTTRCHASQAFAVTVLGSITFVPGAPALSAPTFGRACSVLLRLRRLLLHAVSVLRIQGLRGVLL